MKNFQNIGIGLLTAVLMLASFTSNALALTEACTPINNQATLSYKVGTVDQTPIASDGDSGTAGAQATTFSVATKVDLTVAGGTVLSVVPNAVDQVLTYSITNTGNDQQRYNLRVWAADGTEVVSGHTDNFNMSNVDVYTDDDNDYTTGTPTLIASNVATDGSNFSGYTAVVEPGATIYVHLVADVPGAQPNGDAAVYALQAITHQPTGLDGIDIGDGTDGGETDESASTTNGCGDVVVLADGDVDGASVFEAGTTDLSDAAKNGYGYAVGVYHVTSAAISVTKSQVTLWDPINFGTSPQPIPGAYVTYTLTIANNGASSATLSQIVDDLQDTVLALDVDFYTGGDTDPAGGPYTNGAAGRSVEIDYGGTSTRVDTYGTAADSGSDTDGVEFSGGLGGVLTVYFTDPGSEGTVLPAGTYGGTLYTQGELKTGESVAISFNVIIQ